MAGRMGYTEHQFRCTTPRYFYVAADGFLEAEELQERAHWERARLMAYYAAAPHIKNFKISDVMKFTWEKPRAQKIEIAPKVLAQLHTDMDAAAAAMWGKNNDN